MGLNPRYQPLLKEFDPISNLFPTPVTKPKRSFVVSTGMAVQNLIDDTVGLIAFTGHLFSDLVWSVKTLSKFVGVTLLILQSRRVLQHFQS